MLEIMIHLIRLCIKLRTLYEQSHIKKFGQVLEEVFNFILYFKRKLKKNHRKNDYSYAMGKGLDERQISEFILVSAAWPKYF